MTTFMTRISILIALTLAVVGCASNKPPTDNSKYITLEDTSNTKVVYDPQYDVVCYYWSGRNDTISCVKD